MKNQSIAKKFIVLALVLSTTFSSLGAQRASAWVDVANLVPNWVTGVATPATTVTTGAGTIVDTVGWTWTSLGKNTLDALAYGVAQRILSALTENIIGWIRGGFAGSPSFAVDTQQILDDITESIAGDLIREIQDISVCEFSVDFVYDLTDSVSLAAAKKKKKPYTPNCPFDGNLTFGASQFYDDFNRGGWTAFSAALGEGGNPYDVQIATAEETLRRKQEKVSASDKKLSWSNGFTDILDTSDCNYPDDVLKKMALTGTETATELSGMGFNPGTQPPSESEKKAWQKAHCKTTTPGKIVGDQLTKTLGLDMDRLGFADNMNKIISAFLDVLTQKALRAVFAKDSSPSTQLTPILNASETATLNIKIAEDSTVMAAQTTYDNAGGHFEWAVTQYDSAKVIYDTAWASYNSTTSPTNEQQTALDEANIILKTAAVEMDLAKSDLSTATTALTSAKKTAKTTYTAQIVAARSH
ncbi:MAG: hypothetical protein AAB497_03145 [Patescibacteria group bacterium]